MNNKYNFKTITSSVNVCVWVTRIFISSSCTKGLFGPPGGPVAIRTRLGWTLQGPARIVEQQLRPQQCLLTSTVPTNMELLRNVEKLWQLAIQEGQRSDPVKTGPGSCHST